MDRYIPKPVDTSGITLPKEIVDIGEKLAKNTHETWAAQRLADGWTYGAERNDQAKIHPCLIPYEELSETEKTYDRNTAMETLKLIIALGYEIRKKEQPSE